MNDKYTILITGATGFIGKHLIESLPENKFIIYCLSRKFDALFTERYSKSCTLLEIDLLNLEKTKEIILRVSPNYVVHLASSKSRSNKIETIKNIFENNFNSSLNLFQSLLSCPTLKLLTVIGSIEEYGDITTPFIEEKYENPISIYGLSKLSITKLSNIFFKEHKLPIVILRPSIVYGPRQSTDMFIPAIISAMIKKEKFKMTLGEQLRDFIYIDDLINAIIAAINTENLAGLTINIASGISYKLLEVANLIAEKTETINLLEVGAIEYRTSEIMNYTIDISKATFKLNWSPNVSLHEGLSKTILSYVNE